MLVCTIVGYIHYTLMLFTSLNLTKNSTGFKRHSMRFSICILVRVSTKQSYVFIILGVLQWLLSNKDVLVSVPVSLGD